MDSITQAALGAAIGEVMLGKKLGNRALLWGAFFGTLPDLDVLVSPLLDTAQKLEFHRGASHSLLVMTLASVFIGKGLAKLWSKEKIPAAFAGWFVFAVWSTHVLIDCFTVYGTSVLWPFSPVRVGFNHLFIIDFFYTLPLLVTLVWLAFLKEAPAKKTRGKKPVPVSKRRRLCWWGLGLSTGYALLSVGMKFTASAGFDADLARRGVKYERRMEAPTPFNILLWRSVVDRGDDLWVGYRSVFEFHSTPVRWTIYPRHREILKPLKNEREIKTVTWFTDGWWIARQHKNGIWVGDMRFGESREWGARKGMVDSRLAFSWIMNSKEDGDRLEQLGPSARDAGESLRRMGWRILGKRDEWEANPRLAGIPGSFPEFLAVEE